MANEPQTPSGLFWRNEEWRMEKLKKPNGRDSNESRRDQRVDPLERLSAVH